MSLCLEVLIIQFLLGGFGRLRHPEVTKHSPRRRPGVAERRLRAMREVLSAGLLIAFSGYQWQGLWVLLISGALLATMFITVADFLVEHRVRQCLPLERALHTALALNSAALLFELLPLLAGWWTSPNHIVAQSQGAVSWLLALTAAGLFLSGLRNVFAALALARPPEWVRNPLRVAHPAASRTVLVNGATGFLGVHLVRSLLARGERVVVLTRDAGRARDRFGPHVRIVTELEAVERGTRIDAIVNLDGAPIFGLPWSARRLRLRLSSRVETTRGLLRLAARLERPPGVCISASAIGIYGPHHDEALDEHSAPGETFAAALCRDWEAAALPAEALGMRLVRIRIGLVLHRGGGALPWLALPLRFFAGAVLGSGRQWVSWIHLEDLLRLFEFALDRPAVRGIYNGVAPTPVTHRDFQLELARQLHRPIWLRIPAGLFRTLRAERAQLLIDGQRVLPNRVVATGFRYRYPRLTLALHEVFAGDLRLHEAAAAVYFNGDCPVCSTEMRLYAGLCERARVPLTFIDSSRSDADFAESGLHREHLARRVYMRSECGDVLSGMPALIALWRRLPGYAHLARVVSLPLVRQGSELLYDHLIAPALAWWAARRALHRPDAAGIRRELV